MLLFLECCTYKWQVSILQHIFFKMSNILFWVFFFIVSNSVPSKKKKRKVFYTIFFSSLFFISFIIFGSILPLSKSINSSLFFFQLQMEISRFYNTCLHLVAVTRKIPSKFCLWKHFPNKDFHEKSVATAMLYQNLKSVKSTWRKKKQKKKRKYIFVRVRSDKKMKNPYVSTMYVNQPEKRWQLR